MAGGCSNAENDVQPAPVSTGESKDGGVSADGAIIGAPANSLRAFTPPSDPGSGGILFTASGEVLALTGYPFPPASDGDPAFVDGWEIAFSHVITTLDGITLSANPDTAAGDQSRTGGAVAIVKGPWAVDLSRSDPSYLAGKAGAGEQAVPIAALGSDSSGAAFQTDGTRYAFGYDTVAAQATAYNVNLDADAIGAYLKMVEAGCAVLYKGTATFKGDKSDPSCYPDTRKTWPDVVDFELCFKSPVSYLNCQNPDNDPATPFGDEEHQRGIAFKSGGSVIAQMTIHTDHPFWDSVLHDSPMHFDQFAARAVSAANGSFDAGARDANANANANDAPAVPLVTLESTKGVDYTDITDALGNHLQWRYCLEPATDVHPKFAGAMSFDPESVPHAISTDPASGLRDYYDFATYDQSTQGHLNSDGLCFVRRNYPSPQ